MYPGFDLVGEAETRQCAGQYARPELGDRVQRIGKKRNRSWDDTAAAAAKKPNTAGMPAFSVPSGVSIMVLGRFDRVMAVRVSRIYLAVPGFGSPALRFRPLLFFIHCRYIRRVITLQSSNRCYTLFGKQLASPPPLKAQ